MLCAGVGGGREAHEGGDTYTPMADSSPSRETKTTLSSNYPPIKKNKLEINE